ncbi:iron ABC transporter permease [Paenibacillus sp. IB182496]|uniref:Iron ABC transporter permease n=1 Tax=Paenibacillus sabuli TaxID=2772509 RepID=A0A927GRC5_9BACL|nr:iron ABC transporter permease [Paenibacillus sabuli]
MTAVGLILLLLAIAVWQLMQGKAKLGLLDILEAWATPAEARSAAQHIVLSMRLPRAVLGMLVGGALAVAGTLLQTLTRNPIASAGTLGINAGAYLAVVAGTIFWPALASGSSLVLAAVGATAAALFVYGVAGGMRATPVRMALAGMATALVMGAVTGALQLLYENETSGLFLWGSGTLIQIDWSGVSFAWPWVAAGTAAALILARPLDLLLLDEETGRSLGQRIAWTRLLVLAVAILLAAVAVSVAGPIGFVGLIAPHLMRLLGLRRHAALLPFAFLTGALLLSFSDLVVLLLEARFGLVPVGAITALVGGPWLIWLILRMGRRRLAGGDVRADAHRGRTRAVPLRLALALTGAALAVVLAAGLAWGSLRIPLGDLLAVLTGGGSDLHRMIVLDQRLPRILVAALAGAALAVSGLLLQGVVRNPLADPSIVGITSGAGAGALLLLIVLPQLPVGLLPVAAFAGGILAAATVYVIALRNQLQPVTLALIGIAVSACAAAIIQMLVVHAQLRVAVALAWLAGSTYARGWDDFALLAAWPIVLIPLAWLLARRLDLLALGDASAVGLGLRIARTRLQASLIAVALASAAVAIVGTVGFVGLMAPHVARLLVGHRHRGLFPLTALLGAGLLVAADWLGRTVLAPKEIPSGLVVALLGAPFLLWLMRDRRGRGAA